MIYFDNAATSLPKPKEVMDAVVYGMSVMGNAGRGVNEASLSAARGIYEVRTLLCDLFHGEDPSRIAFTANSTESLNTAIKGLLKPGDHVITTVLEHNSVLRPLYEMEKKGVELTILPCDTWGRVDVQEFEHACKENTKAIVCTHGSNLTGNLLNITGIGEIARNHKIVFVVDASQTAGVIPIDVQQMKIDVLCFTGHKGLLGPQGTGGVYVREGIAIRPLKTGGSGVHSFDREHPSQMPTALEAGTLNGPGIAGLGAGIGYINRVGLENIRNRELEWMHLFYDGICEIPKVKIYGDFSSDVRCPIVAFNIGDYDSAQVGEALYEEYGISIRSGAHCAPLLHEALKTAAQGAVRFSFSHFNTEQEVKEGIRAVKELAKE